MILPGVNTYQQLLIKGSGNYVTKNKSSFSFKNISVKDAIVYALTLVFSIVFIVWGRNYVMLDYPDLGKTGETSYKAQVTEILSEEQTDSSTNIVFMARLKGGDNAGDEVQVVQSIRANYYPVQEPVSEGDAVIIYRIGNMDEASWAMTDYSRSDYILWLGLVFCLAVLIFGRMKGINTLISLAFTCLSVFYVFLPSILAGKNIYLWSIMVCIYMIVMTMLFINGACKKSLVAGLGCLSGVVAAGLITLLMNNIMNLTGMTSEDTLYLQLLDTANPIDLRGIIFAAIIIGAVGAIMDVAMDISSSLNEMKENIPDADARLLIRSGFNIGRDIMGTMANTLVLAYIGCSLTTTVLLMAYNVSTMELFNMELIVVEVLQALAGSLGMLLAIPLTTLISAAVFTGSHRSKRAKDKEKPTVAATYTTTYTMKK